MTQIGHVIGSIFATDMTYARYVDEIAGHLGPYGRIVTEAEFNELRSRASTARTGVQVVVVLPNWSPRFHIANARRVFVEMRAAHDRLFNVLDAYLAWANGNAAARSQMGVLEDPVVLDKAERQIAAIEGVKSARAYQRSNVGNAIRAAQEVANMYIRAPFNSDANDTSNPMYYEMHAEAIRYNDLLNQNLGLEIADLYDDSAIAGLEAERERTNLEFAGAVSAVANLDDRQVLLGFDFTSRIVDALKDVFQNASDVVTVARNSWGMHQLERLSPDYQAELGWFFSLGYAFWPPWMSLQAEDAVGFLLGDTVLGYLDQSEGLIEIMERNLREFDAAAARALVTVKLRFSGMPDGTSRAVLKVPKLSRYQEVNALYVRDVPTGVSLISCHRPEARVAVLVNMQRQLVCTAELQKPEHGTLTFGSDGGMGGDEAIFALESDCLMCSHVGDQTLELVCRNDPQPDFEAQCTLRIVGYNPVD